MQERAKKSPSTLEWFSQTRADYSFNSILLPTHFGITLQGISTRRHRYRVFKCRPHRLRLDRQGMASITERRCVLGAYACPRMRCPRFSYERGGIGRFVKGVGGCIVGEGTHLIFLFLLRFTDLEKSGLYWP